MSKNSEENIGWLHYLFDFIEKDFRTMDTLTDESHGDKLIEEFKQGNCNPPGNFLCSYTEIQMLQGEKSPEEQKNPMFDHQPTNKQSSSEKPPTSCSNEENSSMCGQIIKTEKMTTSKQGLQVLLIAPLLALAATQNKHNPLFLNNQEDKSAFLQGIDMTLGRQRSVDDHTNLQTDKETIKKMMFLKQGEKDPDEGIIKGSVSLKQQTKEPEEVSNHFERWSMLPSDDTDKETINEMMFFPDLDYLYEGTVPWEYTQALGPQIFPDVDSLDEETQVFTDVPWEYTQDLGPQIIPDQESLDEENQVFTQVPWECTQEATDGQAALHLATQWGKESVVTTLIEHGANINLADSEAKTVLHHAIQSGQHGIINLLLGCPGIDLQARDKSLSLGSIDSEASSKKYNFKAYHHDRHQCDLVKREDEDHIIQHPSLNFGQLNDQKTGKQLSNNDENFGKIYQKFSHLVTQMAMEDRKEVDLEMNCLSIDSKKVVLLL